jgi:hypothetical protein
MEQKLYEPYRISTNFTKVPGGNIEKCSYIYMKGKYTL